MLLVNFAHLGDKTLQVVIENIFRFSHPAINPC